MTRNTGFSFLRRLLRRSQSAPPEERACAHLGEIRDVTPNSDGCEACRQSGDTWVNLRLCMTCGNVACCDDSKNRHARKHAQAAEHPIIRSFVPGESWMWCYVEEVPVA